MQLAHFLGESLACSSSGGPAYHLAVLSAHVYIFTIHMHVRAARVMHFNVGWELDWMCYCCHHRVKLDINCLAKVPNFMILRNCRCRDGFHSKSLVSHKFAQESLLVWIWMHCLLCISEMWWLVRMEMEWSSKRWVGGCWWSWVRGMENDVRRIAVTLCGTATTALSPASMWKELLLYFMVGLSEFCYVKIMKKCWI